jgi:hypothetical protein
MTTVVVDELESAMEKWITSTGAATKGHWNRYDGFWLVSDPRQAHFRLCFDGSIEIELFEGPACKAKAAPLSSVQQALQLVDVFLRRKCRWDALPGGDWKTSWAGCAVPAAIIEHPERITIEQIDNEDSASRWAMIAQYGEKRYWRDTRLNPTGFIEESKHIENVIENWRAKTRARITVVRTAVREDDPRNCEEFLVVRLGSRQVHFGEPRLLMASGRTGRVWVSVSEGGVKRTGYLSRREEAEHLLDVFLRLRCRFEELPPIRWQD